MNLLIDIGNTRVKWALAHGDALVETGALVRAEQGQWPRALPMQAIDAIHVASVAHDSALEALRDYALRRNVPLHRASSGARSCDLVNGYTDPERLGVDRWMACVAAQARGPGSVLVADAGTALTLDWVDAQGRHEGGLITPGVAGMRSVLRGTTQLRPESAPETGAWLARDTDSAIAAGTLHSALALLDNAVTTLSPDRLLLTGGEATLLVPMLRHHWEPVPHLVLEGLALHAERQAQGSQHLREPSE